MKTTDIGKVYGFLKVVGIERDYIKKRTYYICDCLYCGKKKVKLLKDNIVSGRTSTCGCLQGKKLPINKE